MVSVGKENIPLITVPWHPGTNFATFENLLQAQADQQCPKDNIQSNRGTVTSWWNRTWGTRFGCWCSAGWGRSWECAEVNWAVRQVVVELLLAQLSFARHLTVGMIVILHVDSALRSELEVQSAVSTICAEVVSVVRLSVPENKNNITILIWHEHRLK